MSFLTFRLHPIVNGRCGCSKEACDRAGKHPAESWRDVPTDRPELVATDDSGVGIKTGAVSGVFVVDLDVKNGIDGFANFAALGQVPPTYTVATPTGGFHLYFKHPGFVVKTSAAQLAPGVDVRGDGGYVVAPGSPHRNGGRYTVKCAAPVAEAPAWLLARPELRPAEAEPAEPVTEIEGRLAAVPRDWRIAQAKQWVDRQPPAIEGEGGDAHTYKILTRAVHEWCLTDADMIADAFVDWNARCSPPWGAVQWAHKVDRALHLSTLQFDTLGVSVKHKIAAPVDMGRQLAEVAAVAAKPPIGNAVTCGCVTVMVGGFDAELPPLDFQIDGLVCKADVCMLVAHGNSLKTWVAFSIAQAVASGRPWLGRFMTKRGRVCIADLESGEYEVVRRLKLLGVKDADVGDRLMRASYPEWSLLKEDTWIDLAALKLDLLIVDSFNAAAPDVDENDARSALVLKHAGRFANHTGCTVIVIHHARKGSGGDAREKVRGSTAIFADCDRIFEFTEPEKSDGGIVRTSMRSIKDGAGRRPADVSVELSDQGLRFVEEPAKVEEKTPTAERIRAQVVSFLKKHTAGIGKSELRDMLDGNTNTKRAVLAEMFTAGLLLEFGQPGRKKIVVLNGNVEH